MKLTFDEVRNEVVTKFIVQEVTGECLAIIAREKISMKNSKK